MKKAFIVYSYIENEVPHEYDHFMVFLNEERVKKYVEDENKKLNSAKELWNKSVEVAEKYEEDNPLGNSKVDEYYNKLHKHVTLSMGINWDFLKKRANLVYDYMEVELDDGL